MLNMINYSDIFFINIINDSLRCEDLPLSIGAVSLVLHDFTNAIRSADTIFPNYLKSSTTSAYNYILCNKYLHTGGHHLLLNLYTVVMQFATLGSLMYKYIYSAVLQPIRKCTMVH